MLNIECNHDRSIVMKGEMRGMDGRREMTPFVVRLCTSCTIGAKGILDEIMNDVKDRLTSITGTANDRDDSGWQRKQKW